MILGKSNLQDQPRHRSLSLLVPPSHATIMSCIPFQTNAAHSTTGRPLERCIHPAYVYTISSEIGNETGWNGIRRNDQCLDFPVIPLNQIKQKQYKKICLHKPYKFQMSWQRWTFRAPWYFQWTLLQSHKLTQEMHILVETSVLPWFVLQRQILRKLADRLYTEITRVK